MHIALHLLSDSPHLYFYFNHPNNQLLYNSATIDVIFSILFCCNHLYYIFCSCNLLFQSSSNSLLLQSFVLHFLTLHFIAFFVFFALDPVCQYYLVHVSSSCHLVYLYMVFEFYCLSNCHRPWY